MAQLVASEFLDCPAAIMVVTVLLVEALSECAGSAWSALKRFVKEDGSKITCRIEKNHNKSPSLCGTVHGVPE
jgi:hypothetical protein